MKIQLLCTFSNNKECGTLITSIKKFYTLSDKKIFVFKDKSKEESILLTYNILAKDIFNKLPCTISIHRKKQTNTLYTLNALNRIILEENGGKMDKNYQIDWELFKNTLIITTDEGYRTINLELIDVIKI
jgi:hypothetical protein